MEALNATPLVVVLQAAEVEALKKQVAELQAQLSVAKKIEEVSEAMQRLEGMAMQSASTTSKGQAEVRRAISLASPYTVCSDRTRR